MANGEDIIIKGGSVEIAFDEQAFPGQGRQVRQQGQGDCECRSYRSQQQSNATCKDSR
jgi:hypothetical protein